MEKHVCTYCPKKIICNWLCLDECKEKAAKMDGSFLSGFDQARKDFSNAYDNAFDLAQCAARARLEHRRNQSAGRFISKDDILNTQIYANTELDRRVSDADVELNTDQGV